MAAVLSVRAQLTSDATLKLARN
eukprot:COSAG05_NODE_13187_length_439_cov_0.497059_1_plen_22_part_10